LGRDHYLQGKPGINKEDREECMGKVGELSYLKGLLLGRILDFSQNSRIEDEIG